MRKAVVLLVPLLVAVVASSCSSGVTLVDHPAGTTSGTAHVGDTLDLYTLSGKHFSVTLTKVIDPATGTKKASPGGGERFVATVFRITDTSGKQLQANLGADTVVLSSTGTQYNHDPVELEDTRLVQRTVHLELGPVQDAVCRLPASQFRSRSPWCNSCRPWGRPVTTGSGTSREPVVAVSSRLTS